MKNNLMVLDCGKWRSAIETKCAGCKKKRIVSLVKFRLLKTKFCRKCYEKIAMPKQNRTRI